MPGLAHQYKDREWEAGSNQKQNKDQQVKALQKEIQTWNKFDMRGIKNSCPAEVIDTSSLEVFKQSLGSHLPGMVWGFLPWAGIRLEVLPMQTYNNVALQ